MLSMKKKERESGSKQPAVAIHGACTTCACKPTGRMSSLILTLVGKSSANAKTMLDLQVLLAMPVQHCARNACDSTAVGDITRIEMRHLNKLKNRQFRFGSGQ